MQTEITNPLVRLSDSGLTLYTGTEDVRGFKVLDRKGEEVGKIVDLFIDEGERRVRFLDVALGGVLGVGTREVLIPIDAATEIRDDQVVRVDQTRDQLTATPEYPEERVEDAYWSRLYEHFGHRPFWSSGYRYPDVRRITM